MKKVCFLLFIFCVCVSWNVIANWRFRSSVQTGTRCGYATQTWAGVSLYTATQNAIICFR
jgi:hypothetical protein